MEKIYPKITIGVTEGTSSELKKWQRQQAGYGHNQQTERRHEMDTAEEGQIIAWVPRDHPAVQLGKLPLKALETEPFIEMYPGVETDNSRMFAKNNIKVNARFFATDNLAAYSMVSEGLGTTTVNEIFAKKCGRATASQYCLWTRPRWWMGIALPRIENSLRSPKIRGIYRAETAEYPLTTR